MAVELSEVYNAPLPVPQSLWHLFTEAVLRSPLKRAVSAHHQSPATLNQLLGSKLLPELGWLSWTWTELQTAVLRIAYGLVEKGASRGSTLVTLLPSGIEREVSHWVSVALQMTYVPLDERLADPGREDELKYYLSTADANGVFVVKDEMAAKAIDVLLGPNTSGIKLTVDKMSRMGWQSLVDVASKLSENDLRTTDFLPETALEDEGNRIALVLFTSGTSTGTPKGCPLTVRNMLHAGVHRAYVTAGPSSWIVHSACFRAIANYAALTYAQNSAELIIPNAVFTPESSLHAIEQSRAEGIQCVPFQIHQFATDPTLKDRDLDSVKIVTLSGDIITADLVEKARFCFPSAKVVSGHGMTEAAGVIGIRTVGKSPHVPQFESIMSVGVPSPGTNLRVCDDDGKPVVRGQVGNLLLSGPGVLSRYLNDVQPEAFSRDHVGSWLHTGDRAFLDDAGYVYILGRSKDIIKKKGMSLSPAVITSTLNRQPGVHATAFGVPHAVYGEVPVAVVKDEIPAHDPEEIKSIVQANLGADYALDRVFMLSDLGFDEIPLNPSGKVMNLILKEAVLKLGKKQ